MSAVSAAIYIRVSTEEQTEGWSLEAQRELCKRRALQRGWSVYKVYEEPGQSAKTDRRPVFQQMLREAERQRFDIILVHKLDRFSRSLPDVVGNVALCWLPDTSVRVDAIHHPLIRMDALSSQHRSCCRRCLIREGWHLER